MPQEKKEQEKKEHDKKEQEKKEENDDSCKSCMYVVEKPDPQSKPTSKISSKRSSKMSLSQNFSNFSFYNRSSNNKKTAKESAICRCEEKFDIVRQHSSVSYSSSSSESVGTHHCKLCRCVNCPLKQFCWFISNRILSICLKYFLRFQMIPILMKR